MRTKLQQLIYWLSGSYWFLPAIMAFLSIIASQVMIQTDRGLTGSLTDGIWFETLNEPEGARALLATVAGSMITVAGVTFSLTILAVSYATSHYGPRLIDNFMHDRGNQITLGTFLATFLYCLLVLRSVRSATATEVQDDTLVFVPHLSILLAIILTLASVGVLIFFIHHIPESIHISTVLTRISKMLETKVDQLFPSMLGEPMDDAVPVEPTWQDAVPIPGKRHGYVQGCDEAALLHYAQQHDTVVRLFVRPGDRVLIGQTIAQLASPHSQSDEGTESDAQQYIEDFQGALAIGRARTPTQDIFYVFNQFIEIAVRALSPGVNDPITAIQCIDQIAHGWVLLSRRQMPNPYRTDEDGNLRLITTQPTWRDIVRCTADQLIPYAASDPNVSRHLRETIGCVCEISNNDAFNRELQSAAEALAQAQTQC